MGPLTLETAREGEFLFPKGVARPVPCAEGPARGRWGYGTLMGVRGWGWEPMMCLGFDS